MGIFVLPPQTRGVTTPGVHPSTWNHSPPMAMGRCQGIDWNSLTTTQVEAIISQIIAQRINEYRAAAGLPELKIATFFQTQTQEAADTLKNDWSHNVFDRTTGAQFDEKLGPGGWTGYRGENIAARWFNGINAEPVNLMASGLFNQWRTSTHGHNETMLGYTTGGEHTNYNVMSIAVDLDTHNHWVYAMARFFDVQNGDAQAVTYGDVQETYHLSKNYSDITGDVITPPGVESVNAGHFRAYKGTVTEDVNLYTPAVMDFSAQDKAVSQAQAKLKAANIAVNEAASQLANATKAAAEAAKVAVPVNGTQREAEASQAHAAKERATQAAQAAEASYTKAVNDNQEAQAAVPAAEAQVAAAQQAVSTAAAGVEAAQAEVTAAQGN